MNHSLTCLCEALKQIFNQLKPQSDDLSFLILTGRSNQGKSTLMRQSNFDEYPIDADGAHIYFNQHGIIVELGETWINQSTHKLEHTLKQLNRVHRSLKISGIMLCVDINELLITKHSELKDLLKSNAKLLERFGLSLNYKIDVAIIITKMDLLPGFCDFFQSEHPSELSKPMGFSIYNASQPNKISDIFKTQFEQLIEHLGQQVTDKIHSIRSNVKRTLIREFPLQVASLRNLILPLISSISARLFRLQALYLTSGEQGGVIMDRLNRKIQHEFALVVQDQFQQSTNYRPYFIAGALFAFQIETQFKITRMIPKQKYLTMGISALSSLALVWMGYHYFYNAHVLNQVQHELQIAQKLKNNHHATESIYYLSRAGSSLNGLSSNSHHLEMVDSLRNNLKLNTKDELMHSFVPLIVSELEQTLLQSRQSQIERYQALKIYLMLGDRSHYEPQFVNQWFIQHWQADPKAINKKLSLLKKVFNDKTNSIQINQQIVSDTRNYLNALPAGYLFYALASLQFDQNMESIRIKGFHLSNLQIPNYLSQNGFQTVMTQLPTISQQLTKDNWVLERQDLQDLTEILEKAYCDDYVNWWQHFLHNSQPLQAQNYGQIYELSHSLIKANSLSQIIEFVQQNTHPRTGNYALIFNRDIASKFSELNLLSKTNLSQLSEVLKQLEQFSKTLSLVSDQGKTAFTLTKARYQGDKLNNPISELYAQAHQYPEPLSKWTEQIADNLWFRLISDTREYLNHQWKSLIYHDYLTHIAHRYPLDPNPNHDMSLADFNQFFSPHGLLATFSDDYIKPFLDTSEPKWQRKELNHAVVPIAEDLVNELIRANVITHMFFPNQREQSYIEFSLQKINLDPMVAEFQLNIGNTELTDNQNTDSYTQFHWPQQDAQLILSSIEGKHFRLTEKGNWAIFKLLQKVNVLVDDQDSANLQILFEINGNSGRYLLKAQNQVNPFIPGILSGFNLQDHIV